jgi:acyl phosphate:glycerol-3-phosphate acyltransferase
MKLLWLLPLAGYLAGSIPFGYLIVKLHRGGDIRTAGSGNIGATNVTRVAGAAAGALTLLLDAGKGYLAVWAAGRFTSGDITWMAITGLAAIVGHLFPVWIGFRGGKGVATAVGVFVPICWQAVLAALVIWVLTVAAWRYISLASMVAAAAMPLLIYALYAPGHAPPQGVSIAAVLAAVLIILKHRANFARLLAGTENRLKIGGAKE